MKAILLSAALALPPAAQAAEDDGMCRNGLFAESNPGAAIVTIIGKGRAHFFDDTGGCPEAGESCRQKPYLIGGDRVVAGRSKAGWTCVFFPGAGGGSAGWMETSRLNGVPVDLRPALSAWAGSWRSDGAAADITIARSGAGLSIKGLAFWPSRNPDPRQRPGGPNVGEIDGHAVPNGNRLIEDGCSVSLTLLGDWMVASDPTRDCDGMNVTFSGVYRRITSPKGKRR